jgi:hypothetical protein
MNIGRPRGRPMWSTPNPGLVIDARERLLRDRG